MCRQSPTVCKAARERRSPEIGTDTVILAALGQIREAEGRFAA
jgi:hypothetical protein